MMKRRDTILILIGIGLPIVASLYIWKKRSSKAQPWVVLSQVLQMQPVAAGTYRSEDLQKLIRFFQERKGFAQDQLLEPDGWWGQNSDKAFSWLLVQYGLQGAKAVGISATGASKKDRVTISPPGVVDTLIKQAKNFTVYG